MKKGQVCERLKKAPATTTNSKVERELTWRKIIWGMNSLKTLTVFLK